MLLVSIEKKEFLFGFKLVEFDQFKNNRLDSC